MANEFELGLYCYVDHLREQHWKLAANPRFWYDNVLKSQSQKLVVAASDLQYSLNKLY